MSYDGVAISNTQAGQIDIGRFSLDNVSNLSLAIGHDDNLLQSARLFASAGVLNIETEKPHFEDGRSTFTQVQMRGGSFGYLTPALRHWQKLGAGITIKEIAQENGQTSKSSLEALIAQGDVAGAIVPSVNSCKAVLGARRQQRRSDHPRHRARA